MPLVGKTYNIETTVTVIQTITVKADDCARYVLGNDRSEVPLDNWTDEEITNTACGMARDRISKVITQDSLNNPMEISNIGEQELVSD